MKTITFTREQLYNLVWTKTMERITRLYAIFGNTSCDSIGFVLRVTTEFFFKFSLSKKYFQKKKRKKRKQ
ncbi:hypothetical protein B0A66_06015 [Flavobacterium hercynium]|uniref:Uncharacterized protein n=1 Tax=Flavobacterium hercynium TaxID=387094 RepID=A0A226HJJ0_9FLAO|nr:hypothetical protein B0A66_06015 [Flavobacterium hercynium]